MRNSRLLLAGAMIAVCASAAHAAEDVATASVSVNLNLAPRTSLKVSSRVLQFEVIRAGELATASLEFSAGARMPAGSDVVLSVEALSAGGADAEMDLTFAGEGAGTLAGSIVSSQSAMVGRWRGSGVRDGRIVFTLRANAAGSYAVPLRLVLSTP